MAGRPNLALIKAVGKGLRWRARLLDGEVKNVAELAKQVGVDTHYVVRTLRTGFLAPDIVEAILEGQQPAGLSLEQFRKALPLEWAAQRRLLGFGELPEQPSLS